MLGISTVQAAAVALFAFTLVFAGGSSRVDAPPLIAVRMAAVLAIAALILPAKLDQLRDYARATMLVLVAMAVLAVELVPMPSDWWLAMPGHALYAGSAEAAGIAQPWRPWSLMPDGTIESLISLLVAVAALLAAVWAPEGWVARLPLVLMTLAGTSAVLAMFQIAGGMESPLRWYPVMDNDVGTGFLANRNHQGLLMSLGIPTATWWAIATPGIRGNRPATLMVGASVIFLCAIGAIITQSRAAILWVAIALALSGLMAMPSLARSQRIRWIGGGTLGLAALLGTIASILPYARLNSAIKGDDRWSFWAATTDMAMAFFPFGSGGGSFVSIYPRFQANASLRPEYVNHAHNDALELIAEHGLLGIGLIMVLILLVLRLLLRGWSGGGASQSANRARFSGVVIILCMLASLVDYPLRAPLMMGVFAVTLAVNFRRASAGSQGPG